MLVAGITDKKKLENWIRNEPLIETEPSLEGTRKLELPASLYFGIGLCNGGEHPVLSQGLPIDLLSMILVSERVGSDNKQILIADTHAETNGFSKEEISEVARNHEETIHRVVDNLGFKGWEVILASAIASNPAYISLLNNIDEDNDYVKRELADIAWFREQGVRLKAGWALKGSQTDEVAFDRRFTERFGEILSFIYTVPGRTFDVSKPRAPPYVCTNPEARILLQQGENAVRKIAEAQERWGDHGTGAYLKQLNHLTRLYSRIVEPIKGTTEEKVQQVLERCLK